MANGYFLDCVAASLSGSELLLIVPPPPRSSFDVDLFEAKLNVQQFEMARDSTMVHIIAVALKP